MASRCRRVTLLPGAVLWLATGCLMAPNPPPRPAVPTPTPTLRIQQEDVPPPQRLEVEIRDFQATDGADGAGVTVTGTIVNTGNRATTNVVAVVEAFNAAGDLVARVPAVPETTILAPYGGATKFRATLDFSPDVVRYHVEVVAR